MKGKAMRHRLLSFVAVFLFATLVSAQIGEGERLRVETRLAIIFKALTYDHNFKDRYDYAVRMGIVGYSRNKKSMIVAKEVIKSIESKPNQRMKGLEIQAVPLFTKEAKNLKTMIEENEINLLYLSPDLQGLETAVFELSFRNEIPVVTGERTHVHEGAAMAVIKQDGKPRILVNPRVSVKQGIDFDARFLRLAEIVR
jgi:hypothetical protein